MTKHVFVTPEECACDKDGDCMICDGGLGLCRVCGGAEGSLTTECPGFQISTEQSDAIYNRGAGGLDWRNGQWINAVTVHLGGQLASE